MTESINLPPDMPLALLTALQRRFPDEGSEVLFDEAALFAARSNQQKLGSLAQLLILAGYRLHRASVQASVAGMARDADLGDLIESVAEVWGTAAELSGHA